MMYNIVLCYHGFVRDRREVAPFRTNMADFKAQIRLLENLGYSFVSPTDYVRWWRGEWEPAGPICCIMADDGLSSIGLAFDWLIERQIPFGLAVIGRRHGIKIKDGISNVWEELTEGQKSLWIYGWPGEPETEAAGKKRFQQYMVDRGYSDAASAQSGFCEWLDIKRFVDSGYCEILHHTYNLHHLAVIDAAGTPSPVLDAPAWVDDGDVVYRRAGDARWYFDWSLIDRTALGFPLFGSDPWGEYTVPISSTLKFTPKWTGTVNVLRLWAALHRPFDGGYACDVLIRWREFGASTWVDVGTVTISPYAYETRAQWQAREFYTITLPSGFSVTSGTPIELRFETQNAGRGCYLIYAVPNGEMISGQPAAYGVTSCKALVENPDYSATPRYRLDCDYPAGAKWPMLPGVILSSGGGAQATDAEYKGYVEADIQAQQFALRHFMSAEWGYVDKYETGSGSIVSSHPSESFPPEYSTGPGGSYRPDPYYCPIMCGTTSSGQPASSRWSWTATETFTAYGLEVRALPTIMREYGSAALSHVYSMAIALDIGASASGPWTEIGQSFSSWGQDEEFILEPPQDFVAGTTYWFRIRTVNPGYLPAARYWQHAWFRFWKLESAPTEITPTQVCYPFGAFYQDGDGVVEASSISAIHPALAEVFTEYGITAGYSIWPTRNDREAVFREPDMRVTDYTLSRLLIYGDQPPQNVINNIKAYTGALFSEADHGGVLWQVALEPDPAGCATVRRMVDTLGNAAFDAWFYRDDGTILPGPLNDGGIYAGIPYADDRGWLQSRGVRCHLIVSNYNPDLGDIDPAIGSAVVNDPATYVPLLVAIAVDDGWDGITSNLEGVPLEDREAATAFYQALARGLHAAGKALHITAPARTGTDYDTGSEWWWGWCDHTELVKVVDLMKIMSYTETGPGTAAGPHAPAAIFTQFYDYVDSVIPHEYRRRILVGCNSFGHTWQADGSAAYASFHAGLADGLRRSAYLREVDGELTWSAYGLTSWVGSPGTIRRAVEMASKRGYAGVGLWKADDGDLIQHFPAIPWAMRAKDMSFIDARFPEDISYGAQGGPMFSTSVVTTDAGRESRLIRWDAPLCRYTVSHSVKTQQQYDTLLAFFRIMRGRGHSFRFKDWTDYRVQAEQIGVGDGLLVAFQLLKRYSFGAYSVTRQINKPVSGTWRVWLNGVEQTTGWSINYVTGVLTFVSAPAAGVVVTVSGEFDLHARFDTDEMPGSIDDLNAISWDGVAIAEVRVA